MEELDTARRSPAELERLLAVPSLKLTAARAIVARGAGEGPLLLRALELLSEAAPGAPERADSLRKLASLQRRDERLAPLELDTRLRAVELLRVSAEEASNPELAGSAERMFQALTHALDELLDAVGRAEPEARRELVARLDLEGLLALPALDAAPLRALRRAIARFAELMPEARHQRLWAESAERLCQATGDERERAALLRELVEHRLRALSDLPGAARALKALLLLVPSERSAARELLHIARAQGMREEQIFALELLRIAPIETASRELGAQTEGAAAREEKREKESEVEREAERQAERQRAALELAGLYRVGGLPPLIEGGRAVALLVEVAGGEVPALAAEAERELFLLATEESAAGAAARSALRRRAAESGENDSHLALCAALHARAIEREEQERAMERLCRDEGGLARLLSLLTAAASNGAERFEEVERLIERAARISLVESGVESARALLLPLMRSSSDTTDECDAMLERFFAEEELLARTAPGQGAAQELRWLIESGAFAFSKGSERASAWGRAHFARLARSAVEGEARALGLEARAAELLERALLMGQSDEAGLHRSAALEWLEERRRIQGLAGADALCALLRLKSEGLELSRAERAACLMEAASLYEARGRGREALESGLAAFTASEGEPELLPELERLAEREEGAEALAAALENALARPASEEKRLALAQALARLCRERLGDLERALRALEPLIDLETVSLETVSLETVSSAKSGSQGTPSGLRPLLELRIEMALEERDEPKVALNCLWRLHVREPGDAALLERLVGLCELTACWGDPGVLDWSALSRALLAAHRRAVGLEPAALYLLAANALRADPQNGEALAALEVMAQREGFARELAELLQELHERMEPTAAARAARALGHLYEDALEEPDLSIAWYERARAVANGAELEELLERLARLYRDQGERAGLLGALRELGERSAASAKRVTARLAAAELLLSIRREAGEGADVAEGVSEEARAPEAEARALFESVLQLEPANFAALAALEQLYARPGDEQRLTRLLRVLVGLECEPGGAAVLRARKLRLCALLLASNRQGDAREGSALLEQLVEEEAQIDAESALEVLLGLLMLRPSDGALRARAEAQAARCGAFERLAQGLMAALERTPSLGAEGARARLELTVTLAKLYWERLPTQGGSERARELLRAIVPEQSEGTNGATTGGPAGEVEEALLDEARALLATLLISRGEHGEAEQLLEERVERAERQRSSKRVDLHEEAGALRAALRELARHRARRMRDREGAAQAYTRLLALAPDREAFTELAAWYESAQRWSELAALLLRASGWEVEAAPRAALLQRVAELKEQHGEALELAEEVALDAARQAHALAPTAANRALLFRALSRNGASFDLAVLMETRLAELAARPADSSRAPDEEAEQLELYLALARLRAGELEDSAGAAAALEALLALCPGHEEAALELVKLRRAEVALAPSARGWEALLAALAHQLEATESAAGKGACALASAELLERELQRLDMAERHYRDAIRLMPTARAPLAGLRRCYEKQGAWRKAHAALLREAELVGALPGDMAGDSPRDLSSAEAARACAELLCAAAALSEGRLQEPERARAEWARALALDPRSAEAAEALASFALAARDWDAYLSALQYRVGQERGSTQECVRGLEELARWQLEGREQPGEAEALLERAVALSPTHAGCAVALAELLLARGEWRRIAPLLGPLGEEGSPAERSWRETLLALACEGLGEGQEEALAHYETARLLDPEASAPRWRLAAAYGRALDRDWRRFEYLALLEALHGEEGQWEELEQRYLSLLERIPVDEGQRALRLELFGALAELYEEGLGDPERALQAWQVVAQATSGDPEVEARLQRLRARVHPEERLPTPRAEAMRGARLPLAEQGPSFP